MTQAARSVVVLVSASLSVGVLLAGAPLAAQSTPTAEPAPAAAKVTDKMKRDAAAINSIVKSDLAKAFLSATSKLAEPETRTVYRNREKGVAVSKRAFEAMGAEEKASFTAREYPPAFYYETGYGSPLVYARVLDLAAPHFIRGERPKLLDFGYGTIGQLQLLAHCGFDARGVDVEPRRPVAALVLLCGRAAAERTLPVPRPTRYL